MELARVRETGRLSQTGGSLPVKEERMERDSARLEEGKVYHGNKELYVLIQKAVCEKEGSRSLQALWKNRAREISKLQGSR